MPDRQQGGTEPTANRAQLAGTDEIREARDLWALGYTKHGWVCVDEKCRARMVPVAWGRPNEKGRFCREDGTPFERPPYFRAEPAHKPDCNASYPIGPRDRPPPEYHIGPPTDYPHRVILFLPQSLQRDPDKQVELEQGEEDTLRQHARWVRSIREACEYYVDHPDQHWRPLRVDRCPGTTYGECFVRLGTGDQRGVGKNWILYDELRFRDWVELDVEPIRLTLLGAVYRNPRTLIIHTTGWPTEHRKNFRDRLKEAVVEGRAAYNAGRPERPWVFAFARERAFDELEVEATLQPGVDVLVRAMPQLPWRYRPTHRFVTPSQRQPLYSQPQSPSADVAGQHVEQSDIEVAPPSDRTVSGLADSGVAVPCTITDDAQPGSLTEAAADPAPEGAPLDEPSITNTVRQSDGAEVSPPEIQGSTSGLPEPAEGSAEAPFDAVEHELEVGMPEEPTPALMTETTPTSMPLTLAIEWIDGSRTPDDREANESPPPRGAFQPSWTYNSPEEPISQIVKAADNPPELADATVDEPPALNESVTIKQVTADRVAVASTPDQSPSTVRREPEQPVHRGMLQRIIEAVKAWRGA